MLIARSYQYRLALQLASRVDASFHFISPTATSRTIAAALFAFFRLIVRDGPFLPCRLTSGRLAASSLSSALSAAVKRRGGAAAGASSRRAWARGVAGAEKGPAAEPPTSAAIVSTSALTANREVADRYISVTLYPDAAIGGARRTRGSLQLCITTSSLDMQNALELRRRVKSSGAPNLLLSGALATLTIG